MKYINQCMGDMSSSVTEESLSHLEDILAFVTAISQSVSVSQFVAILTLYVKTYVKKSLVSRITLLLVEILNGGALENQSGSDLPMWLDIIKHVQTNWKKVVESAFAQNVVSFLGALCAIGLCDKANFALDVNGLKLFLLPLQDKQSSNTSDALATLFDTVIYFVEGGYRCFQSGSVLPFILSETRLTGFDREYFDIVELAPLMKAGNMEKLKNISENDFDLKLSKTIEECETLYKTSVGTFEKRVFYERLMNLRRIRADFLSIRADGGLRTRPYAYYVRGPSGVGKSSVSAILMRIALLSSGFDASDERIVNLNEADAYMSNYRSYINGVYCDDIGNTMAQFLDKSPVAKVIDLINNVKSYAVMAELDLKGKVTLEPKCVGATSNVHLSGLANQFSNEPYSIISRFNIQVEVVVKPAFATSDGRLDQDKVFAHYGGHVPPIPDLWTLTVYKPHDKDGNSFKRIVIPNVTTLPQLVEYVSISAPKHFALQTAFLNSVEKLDEKLQMCNDCKLPAQLCKCKLANQVGTFSVSHVWFSIMTFGPYLDNQCWALVTKIYVWGVLLFSLKQCWWILMCCLCCFVSSLVMLPGIVLRLGCLVLAVLSLFTFCEYRRRKAVSQINSARGRISLYSHIVSSHTKRILGISTAVFVLYLIAKKYVKMAQLRNRGLCTQGNLEPQNEEEIQERFSEKNPWASAQVLANNNCATDTMTLNQVTKKVETNLCYVEFRNSGGKLSYCNALFLSTNFIVLPYHMVQIMNDNVVLSCRRQGMKIGSYFQVMIGKNNVAQIDNQDLAVIYVLGGPSFKDIRPYLTNVEKEYRQVSLLYKYENGDLLTDSVVARKEVVINRFGPSRGYEYNYDKGTFPGMCGCVLISEAKPHSVLAIHVGGKGVRGGAVSLNKDLISCACERLLVVIGNVELHSEGERMTNQYGCDFMISDEIHEKSPLFFLEKEPKLNVFGTVIGRASPSTKVESTLISAYVEEICGVKNLWGAPQFGPPYWKPWRDTMIHLADPVVGLPPRLVHKACEDFLQPLLPLICGKVQNRMRPLTNDENVCGRNGERFIDAIKANTSVGFPLSGKKSKYMTDPITTEEYQDYRVLDDMFWDEVGKMEAAYLDGNRCYPIFKAALKDEPTKLEKEKVRVFQAAPLAFQLLVRKYFLPIGQFLSTFPIVSECAVGVNAHGPEWDQLAKAMRKFGDNRIFAGDYSKYDLRLPMQLTVAALDIMLQIAKSSGNYSAEDLKIMHGIISDLVCPQMAYHGDLIEVYGSNPSGQNMTVYVNSLANSLILRCAYFALHNSWFYHCPAFRESVSVITYGDDVKGSVSRKCTHFDHCKVAEWLKQYDIVFTMPDKNSEPIPFMEDSDADFLKRKNKFSPELGMFVGMLDEMSIFKSLHCIMHSKDVTNREICAMNIGAALREWFFFGREKYEQRRGQMREVCTRAKLCCPEIDCSFDDMLQKHIEKYKLSFPSTRVF
jgi:hypothetical protein